MKKLASLLRNEGSIDPHSIRTIFDVGAMDGEDSRILKRIYTHAEVYAIEGLKLNFDTYLTHEQNIHAFHAVIADHDGSLLFYEKKSQGKHGIHERIRSPTKAVHETPCSRLDTFIRNHSLPVPDLMKIDVEGATFDVLSGCGSILDTVKILQIETETIEYFRGQKLQEEVYRLLRKQRFDLFFEMTCCKGQNDSIWINRSTRE